MVKPKKRIAHGKPHYSTKVFMKLAKRVHDQAKKRGEKPKWNESQKFAAKYLFQDYKTDYVSKIDLKEVDNIVLKVYAQKANDIDVADIQEIVPEACGSAWSVPMAEMYDVDWWELRNMMMIIDGDIYYRVNGGDQFGYTGIEKRGDTDYFEGSPSPSNIVEELRKYVSNASGAKFNGQVKVRPGYKDDGQNPCAYFMDLVLEVDGVEMTIANDNSGEATPNYEAPTKEAQEKRKSTLKELKEAGRDRNEAREDQRAKRDKLAKSKSRKRPKEQPAEPEKPNYLASLEQFNKMIDRAYSDYKEGISTVKEYKADKAKIMKMIDKLNP